MTDALHLSERMPAVAHGRVAWSEEDQRHLARCAECAAEWRLVRRSARLGAAVAETLDVPAIAAGVRHRLADRPEGAPVRRAVVRWAMVGAIAAAIALAVVTRPWSDGPAVPASAHAVLPELEGLDADEMEAMFEVLPTVGSLPDAGLPGIGDLTEDEIESILRTLEG